MSPENRALCYFYRNPPPGSNRAPLRWAAIASLVWNVDGETHPTPSAVRKCVLGWQRERQRRGRKKGTRKTTTCEDKIIKQCFHKARRPFGFKGNSARCRWAMSSRFAAEDRLEDCSEAIGRAGVHASQEG